MILLKKSVGVLLVFSVISVYLFTLNTDRSFKPLKVGLIELESAKKGTYKVAARIVDINENDFTISNGEISLQVKGRLVNKKLSDLYTQKRTLFGEIQITKAGGEYNLISIKQLESELYIVNREEIKDNVILNTKGAIGIFK
jgi:hypothetical protein